MRMSHAQAAAMRRRGNDTLFDVLRLYLLSGGNAWVFLPLLWLYFGGSPWLLLAAGAGMLAVRGSKSALRQLLSALHVLQGVVLFLLLCAVTSAADSVDATEQALRVGPLKAWAQLATLLALCARVIGAASGRHVNSLTGCAWDGAVALALHTSLVEQCGCRGALAGVWSFGRALLHGLISNTADDAGATLTYDVYRRVCSLTCTLDQAMRG
jgi:hypothetical protein